MKANGSGQHGEGSKVSGLLRRKSDVQKEHDKLTVELERRQLELKDEQVHGQTLMRAEEELWDKFAMLQSAKKGVGCDASARVAAQNEVRAVSSACGKASAAVEENRAALVEKNGRVKSLGEQVRTLFNLLQDIERQVDVIIIEESCVCPQQFFSSFPVAPTGMRRLKEDLPCGMCGRFWAYMALVNLTCGCLFHPCCMFKIVLGRNPHCPCCDEVPSGVWMGQWGLVSNDATMQASIEAWRACMSAEGCAPPLSRKEAQDLVRQIAKPVAAVQAGLSVRKRTALDCNSEAVGGPSKRAHAVSDFTLSETTVDKVERPYETYDVSPKRVVSSDAGSDIHGDIDDEAMPNLSESPCRSQIRTESARELTLSSSNDELVMELLAIAKDAAAEVEDDETNDG